MRTICMILLSGMLLLVGTQPGNAKTCDEVLYIAWDLTTLRPFRGGIRLLEPFNVPHYVGAVCVDNVNKKLEYFSRTNDGFLDIWAKVPVFDMNDKKIPTVLLRADLAYLELGEGTPVGESFFAPINTALFPYWAGEAFKHKGFTVIRREVDAEPDLEWTPKVERTFYYADLETEKDEYDWTEKTCDEVLYVALNGTKYHYVRWDNGPYPNPAKINIPHYLGAVCVDNVDKQLVFAPRDANSPFNENVKGAVITLNSKSPSSLLVAPSLRNREMGEGAAWSGFLAVPKNTALFPHWAGEYLKKIGVEVIRREVNAKLDPEWTPEFKHALPFFEHHTAPDMSYR